METRLLPVDPERPEAAPIAEAARVLRSGGLVAFPTETVYGLGANALDGASVRRIFEAKGRPTRNPLIVHVRDEAAARALAAGWPPMAAALARRFWPGPLTIVVRRREGPGGVPDEVAAGGPTVALRAPAHPVAAALLAAAGLPIAAPSANPSGRISPTRAEHVLGGLGGRIEVVLDGGPTRVGIESTIVDVSGREPRLLRPGGVPVEALEAAIREAPGTGPAALAVPEPGGVPEPAAAGATPAPLPSPGLLARHYAPEAECRLFESGARAAARALAERSLAAGRPVGVLSLARGLGLADARGREVVAPAEPAAYAAGLYEALHRLDVPGGLVLVEDPPATRPWLAVRDRLARAASAAPVTAAAPGDAGSA